MSNREPSFPISGKAYAKLNISLDVTARRPDGYHDMLMLMQTVSICDELTITPEPKWANEPQYPAGKTCQVSILRGIGVMVSA